MRPLAFPLRRALETNDGSHHHSEDHAGTHVSNQCADGESYEGGRNAAAKDPKPGGEAMLCGSASVHPGHLIEYLDLIGTPLVRHFGASPRGDDPMPENRVGDQTIRAGTESVRSDGARCLLRGSLESAGHCEGWRGRNRNAVPRGWGRQRSACEKTPKESGVRGARAATALPR
jgi:hypothetical protein